MIGKLAANIGLNTSRGRISADDLDAMKVHILTQSDENSWLFNRVNEQVERFRAQSEEYKLSKLTEQQKNQRAHQNRQRMQKEEKEQKVKAEKAEKELKRFRAAFPEEGHAPIEYSPYDTLVDMYIETYGLAWDKIPKVRPLKKSIEPLGIGSFAMTRLNNGPGLNDRKMPQVCIPKMMRKLPRRKLLNTGMDEVVCDQMQTIALFDDCAPIAEACRHIVVRLPPC